jgi:antitoxin MazE
MRVAVQKWGNSLALRIPRALAAAAGVEQGTEVEVSVRDGRLVAEPVVRIPTLAELLEGFGAEEADGYEDVPGAVGREAWPDDAPRGREELDPWPADETPADRTPEWR